MAVWTADLHGVFSDAAPWGLGRPVTCIPGTVGGRWRGFGSGGRGRGFGLAGRAGACGSVLCERGKPQWGDSCLSGDGIMPFAVWAPGTGHEVS